MIVIVITLASIAAILNWRIVKADNAYNELNDSLWGKAATPAARRVTSPMSMGEVLLRLKKIFKNRYKSGLNQGSTLFLQGALFKKLFDLIKKFFGYSKQ